MKKETILVVEDELLVGLEIKEDLERLGYGVPEIVSAGEDVFGAVQRCRPAMIVMDIHIEGKMDGIEAAHKIKADFDLPILYLTAYSDAQTLERAAATGPDAYLLKPFDARELTVNVEMILAKARARNSSADELHHTAPLVEALLQPSLLADAEGRIVRANHAAAVLLGAADAKELRGEGLSRFVAAGGSDDPGKGRPVELRTADASGAELVAHVEPVIGKDGKRIGSLVTFDRMSARERLHLESSLEAVNRTFQAFVPGSEAAGPAFVVAGFLLPCASGAGDLIDAFRLDSDTSAFYGLDVMGHGSLASLVAYSLFGIVREVAREKEGADFLRPATLVRRLNARYAGGSEGRPFFTLAYGTVDAATGVFRLARAGHTPCVLLPSRGEPEILNMKGGAIGVLEDLHVEEYEGLLVAGDRIVLVSDGYLEAAFGYDISLALSSLASFLAVNRALDLAQLAGALRNVVEEGRSTLGRDDDASLLLIERRA